MKRSFFISIVFLCFGNQNGIANSQCPIIPLPAQYKMINETFVLNESTLIRSNYPNFEKAAYYLRNQILKYTAIPVHDGQGNHQAGSVIVLKKKGGQSGLEQNREEYELTMQSEKIVIRAFAEEGIYN